MVETTTPNRTRVILWVAGLALTLVAPLRLEGQDPPQGAQQQEDTVLVPVGSPTPEIYVAELSVFEGLHYLGPLQKVTDGTSSYDDQPTFTPDSQSLLYTTEYDYGEQVQTEIHRYYLSSRRETRITRTGESEYAPTPVLGERAFSAIRVEDDSSQRLWRFTMQGMDGEVLFRDLDAVAHHAWGNESTVLLYVLGDPATVRIGDLTTGQTEVVAQGVGRSLSKIPNRNAWSFVDRISPGEAWIREINIGTREIQPIILTVPGGESHAWTPDGVLLMTRGSQIYQWDREVDEDWRLVADLGDRVVTLSGITVSPDGSKIAMVGDPIPDEPQEQGVDPSRGR